MKKLIISTLAVVMLCLSVNAATVAYWRLEEGPNGSTHATDLDNYYSDVSGNGNDMGSWYRPAGITDVPFSAVPQSGTTNLASLRFLRNKNMCVGTYDTSKPIEGHIFNNGWTIEASFRHSYQNRTWEVIVGKDDLNTPGAEEPFWLKFRDTDKKVEVLVVDDAGANQIIPTINPCEPEKWYSIAATFDPVSSNMNLYLKGETDPNYILQGTLSGIPGVSIGNWGTSSWTVARGMWAGGLADYINASIDEVRICDEPLAVNQFLASTGGAAVSPLAYWRFEEGTNGVHNADMDNYYRDSSGNGNDMSTPVLNQDRSTAINDVPFAIVPQTGAADTMARNFLGWTGAGGLQNVGTFGYETTPKPVESNPFDNGFTVECMVKADVNGWQVPVCKDGFDAFAVHAWVDPNFAIKFRDDATAKHIQMHFFDGNTNWVSVETSWDFVPGEWYRIAGVCVGGTQALLYVMQEADANYDLEASTITAYNPTLNTNINIVGGMLDVTRSWAIGRGMFWSGITDPIQGRVDEVRISDTALTPGEFLGTVPEPSLIFGGIALVMLAFRRK